MALRFARDVGGVAVVRARQRRRVPGLRLAAAHAPGGGRASSPRSSWCAWCWSSSRALLSPRDAQPAHPAGERCRGGVLAPAHRAVRGLARVRLGAGRLARAARHGPRVARRSSPTCSASACSPSRSRRSGAARACWRSTFVVAVGALGAGRRAACSGSRWSPRCCPALMRLAQAGVDHALRPPGAAAAETRGVLAAALGRALRALRHHRRRLPAGARLRPRRRRARRRRRDVDAPAARRGARARHHPDRRRRSGWSCASLIDQKLARRPQESQRPAAHAAADRARHAGRGADRDGRPDGALGARRPGRAAARRAPA